MNRHTFVAIFAEYDFHGVAVTCARYTNKRYTTNDRQRMPHLVDVYGKRRNNSFMQVR